MRDQSGTPAVIEGHEMRTYDTSVRTSLSVLPALRDWTSSRLAAWPLGGARAEPAERGGLLMAELAAVLIEDTDAPHLLVVMEVEPYQARMRVVAEEGLAGPAPTLRDLLTAVSVAIVEETTRRARTLGAAAPRGAAASLDPAVTVITRCEHGGPTDAVLTDRLGRAARRWGVIDTLAACWGHDREQDGRRIAWADLAFPDQP